MRPDSVTWLHPVLQDLLISDAEKLEAVFPVWPEPSLDGRLRGSWVVPQTSLSCFQTREAPHRRLPFGPSFGATRRNSPPSMDQVERGLI